MTACLAALAICLLGGAVAMQMSPTTCGSNAAPEPGEKDSKTRIYHGQNFVLELDVDGIPVFDIDWPFLDTSTEIDAWAWNMLARTHGPNTHAYDSMLLSVGQGLKHAGANVAIVAQHSSEAMSANVTAALKHGRKPLVICVGWIVSDENQMQILKQISDLGAFVVLYQTEPRWRPRAFSGLVASYNITEVWDYSRSNLQRYPASVKNISRYMPPGHVNGLDFGIPFASNGTSAFAMGFLGNVNCRPKETKTMYSKFLSGRIEYRNDIWTKEAAIKFLSEYPIQLNTHKMGDYCCPSHEPVEAFRMAQILSNRACVISARSDPLDEAEWEGIVHFAQPSEMPRLLEHLARDVRACQTASFNMYKRHFDPKAILLRSNFLDVWRPGVH